VRRQRLKQRDPSNPGSAATSTYIFVSASWSHLRPFLTGQHRHPHPPPLGRH
jgi:hypothetical protein